MRAIARLNIGGPAIHVVVLAAGLDPNRFETLLVAGRHSADEGDMSYLAAEAGVAVEVIPQLGRLLTPWNDLISFVKLYRLLRRYRPHIVHTHTAKAGLLGRVAARLAGVPLVLHTFHGHVFRGYWGPVRSWITVWIERWLAGRTDAIVTVSESVRRELIEFRIAPPEAIYVLPLGLELNPYVSCAGRRGELRAELGLAADVPLVGTIGRLVPVKNHALFLEAARQLTDAGFGGRFVVVGGGELAAKLQQTAQAFGLAERVYFLGWRHDLDRVYADLDVVVNTSLNEGTPVALIEAMAARVPVVATAVGGVPDLIVAEETGYLVPSGDVAALVHEVQRALADPAAVVAAAQAAVLERHNLEQLLSRAADLYGRLLAERRVCNPTS